MSAKRVLIVLGSDCDRTIQRALMGGVFVSHPSPLAFTVYPLYG